MRQCIQIAILTLIPFLGLRAQDASVNVVHGVPGLPAPVEVRANGSPLFTFDYGDVQGPLQVPAGNYTFEVVLQGNPILSLTATLNPGVSYTAVAHLLEGGNPTLSAFVDDLSDVPGEGSRLVIRHLADAPAVDVYARQLFTPSSFAAVLSGASNGAEAALEVATGTYRAFIAPAGTVTPVSGLLTLPLSSDEVTFAHAVGVVGTPSFQVITFTRDQVAPVQPPLTATISGVSGGGTLFVLNNAPSFGEPFLVGLVGGLPNAEGILHLGLSDQAFLNFTLPLELGFLGAPGNFLYQSTETLLPIQLDGTGSFVADFEIPLSHQADFSGIYCQISYVDAGANAAGLVLSDLLSIEN